MNEQIVEDLKIIQEKITAEEIQNTEAGGLTEVRIILSVLKNLPAMTKAGMQTVQEKLKLLQKNLSSLKIFRLMSA